MLKYASGFLMALIVVVQALTVQAEPAVASAGQFTAGQHYEVLKTPVTTRDKNKIEVVELFWYGCHHCFQFDPLVLAWKPKLAADVDFVGMPAMWSPNMRVHAQAFYTAKALGIQDKIHTPFFKALNVSKQKLDNIESLSKFFASFGVEAAVFEKTFKSFGVDSQVNLAQSRALSYGMQGTPEMIVNGKYRISSDMAGSQQKMLEVADFLIAKERAALKSKK